MFSGIIDAVGIVRLSNETAGGRTIIVSADGYWHGVSSGASIAVDGVCLTVTLCEERDAAFDVVAETVRRTTLGGLRAGDKVNLQKPLTAGAPIDGHFVQGHIDAIGEVVRVEQSDRESI